MFSLISPGPALSPFPLKAPGVGNGEEYCFQVERRSNCGDGGMEPRGGTVPKCFCLSTANFSTQAQVVQEKGLELGIQGPA